MKFLTDSNLNLLNKTMYRSRNEIKNVVCNIRYLSKHGYWLYRILFKTMNICICPP